MVIFLKEQLCVLFMKLEEVVNSVRSLHQASFEASQKWVSVHLNGDAHEVMYKPTQKAIMMGRFYESLTMAFYGGVLGESYSYMVNELGLLTKPDVVNADTKLIFEAKSVYAGQHCMIQDAQMQSYDGLREHLLGYDVRFALFRHTLSGIKKSWKGTPWELFEQLSKQTGYLIVLPYDVVTAFHTSSSTSLVYRYDNMNSPYGACTNLLSSTITSLLLEPERVMERLGFESDGYTVSRFMSPECRLQRFKVRSFPIVQINMTKEKSGVSEEVFLDDVPF